jgi:serine/threonine protein kinase
MTAEMHTVGQPVNEGERTAFSSLYRDLPDRYHVITNVELAQGSRYYEYDAIVVGDNGIWVVEIKAWRGKIDGDAYEWIREDGETLPSPIPTANHKAKVLKSLLVAAGFSPPFIKAVVILVSGDLSADLRACIGEAAVSLDDLGVYFLLDRPCLEMQTVRQIANWLARSGRPPRAERILKHYRLLRQINVTDLYTEYEAEHLYIPGRRARLKSYYIQAWLPTAVFQQQSSRIQRDIFVISQLGDHSNIVQVYDAFPDPDDASILHTFQEWVRGVRLVEVIREGPGAFPTRQIALWMQQACRALAYAHRRKVLHRNLSPRCLIIREDGQLKIRDFDYARAEGQATVSQGQPLGDPCYVAPEQWQFPGDTDYRSDLFSLGVIFHELLSGQHPYGDISQLLQTKMAPIREPETADELACELGQLLIRMTKYLPEERPADADEVLHVLDDLLIGARPRHRVGQ